MKDRPLVSIIIPIYNRADLIGETIDSILVQTYQNWECLIIDDGSTDNTLEVVGKYAGKDSRIQFYERPGNYKPGGNGARNYGLDVSQGSYIVFFDSDDLMVEHHLQSKYELLTSGDFDFGITRTKYFNHSNTMIDKYYNYSTKDITKENYILQNINWLTLDVIIKVSIAKQLRFNEILRSGQEYNYFSKLICLTEKGVFRDEVLSLRRYHESSIRNTVAIGSNKFRSSAVTNWFTYRETEKCLSLEASKRLFLKCYSHVVFYKSRPSEIDFWQFWKTTFKLYRHKAFIKLLFYFVNKFSSKMYFLRERALKY